MNRLALRRSFHLSPGAASRAFEADLVAAAAAADGLWRADPSVWSGDAAVQSRIANRLGWLRAPGLMRASLERLRGLRDEARSGLFDDVVLLGMGGSSLAPEVLRAIVGVQPGFPRLHMLDSTDPAAVRAVTITPARTLFILASKSGGTIEPNSLAAYFRQALLGAGVRAWADHFIAITDPGTELEARARSERYRATFVNPPDIGGRYSALSLFGLVPAALMGQDVAALIEWGDAMLEEARSPDTKTADNPAVALGALMAAAARTGRDKLTLLLPPSFDAFGLWVEQLVAESTGKSGVGVVPVAGEALGAAPVYGADRLFVRLRLAGQPDPKEPGDAVSLAPAPFATLDVEEPAALGAEFMRWEIATAIAGALLRINPFDEPNVQQAKDATHRLLDHYAADGHLPTSSPDGHVGAASLSLTSAARTRLGGGGVERFLTVLGEGDYLSLLAYLGPSPELAEVLQRFRMAARDRYRVATMSSYGPRYLHSTGQLHKGGPNTGVFVLITATPAADVDIPGSGYSFGTLEQAQALGDFASLDDTGRRGLHVHLAAPDPRALDAVLSVLLASA